MHAADKAGGGGGDQGINIPRKIPARAEGSVGGSSSGRQFDRNGLTSLSSGRGGDGGGSGGGGVG